MLRLLVLLGISLTLFLDAAPLKILSLFGGGVRGVVTLEFLQNLERETGLKCHEDFEIYAGTSTGAIIASLLACGVSVETIMENYQKLAQGVFSDPNLDQFAPKYDSRKLKHAIQEAMRNCGISTRILLSQLNKKLVIPTVTLNNPMTKRWGPEILDNIQGESGTVELLDAILESSAAPTYFSSYKDHVDGGIAMTDPSLAALITAFDLGSRDINHFTLLSIGTGYTNKYVKNTEKWGKFSWLWKGSKGSSYFPLLEMLFDVQEQIPSQFCSQLLGNRYLKIDFVLPKAIPLDAYESISDLIEETNVYIRENDSTWHDHCQWVRDHLICS